MSSRHSFSNAGGRDVRGQHYMYDQELKDRDNAALSRGNDVLKKLKQIKANDYHEGNTAYDAEKVDSEILKAEASIKKLEKQISEYL